MSELARALLRDLARASEHLLDEGFASRANSTASASGVRGPLGSTLRLSETLQRTVPRALVELERLPATDRETVVCVREPRRATPSRRPYDYAEHAGALAPVVWESRLPELELPTAHLAWLLHGTNLLLERLAWHRVMFERSHAEAVRFREGTAFGAEELARLDENRAALEDADRAAVELRSRLHRHAAVPLRPSPRLPYPFPNAASWRTLRPALRALADPSVSLPTLVADLHHPEAAGVDLAYLYQRWCGWKLVQALEQLGVRPTTDPIPPLLLAGAIEFRSPTHAVTLLCEPRLASRKRSLLGLFVTHGEASPDLVLISRSEAGHRVYVLDPTLSRSPEIHREKAKYLDVLSVHRSVVVAGVHFPSTGPDRAWAAAPIQGRACQSADWRGTHGVVPMDPLGFEEGALRGWLGDLLGGG